MELTSTEFTYINASDYDLNTDAVPTDSISPLPQISSVQWVSLILYIIVVVLGVPGNALVVWITTFEMKTSVNTVWFLNLAVADLLCCLSLPFTIMELALGYWPLRLFACKFLSSILLVNMYASVLLLTMISIDRCALVIKPIWCQNHRTVRKAYLACLVMWIVAIILNSPSMIFLYTRERENGKEDCIYNYDMLGFHKEKVEAAIAIFRLLVGFIIPFLVITACYSILVKKVSRRFTNSNKTLKVVLVVIIGFFLCWLPYHVAGLILALNSSKSAIFKSTLLVDPVLIAIAFINSCINPIIYVLVGQEFKSKFKRSINLIIKNVLAEEMSQSSDAKRSKSTISTKNTEALV
ncbi:C5a anaphylatoxin chemotactic receptor 1-like [Pseudophryne corroboree]|uniref:C5a anaphylatoxin chemotactic receptor 1-like n=1 Tax=Pseudophryne corroboree TaxID=495146 RepID=UPI003081CC84